MNEIAKMTKIRAWADQIEEWRRSGLTQAAWARSHGMTRDTFKYRKRQVEEYALSIMKGERQIVSNISLDHEEESSQIVQEDIVSYPEERNTHQLVQLPLFSQSDEQVSSPGYTIEICLSTCTIHATNEASEYLLRAILKELRYA